MEITSLIAFVLLFCSAIAERLGDIYMGSDLAPPQPFSHGYYCSNNGPVLFRPRVGASIPNCMLPPGPAKGTKFIEINLHSKRGYQCPNKGYLCGYHFGYGRKKGTATVKCCRAKLVSYDDRECIWSYRVDVPKSMSPALPGYYLVGAIPVALPRGYYGFYNKECPFRLRQSERVSGKMMPIMIG